MPRNGSGTYTPTAGNPVVTDTTISSTWANALVNDLANEVTASLDRNGRGGMLAPLRLVNGNGAVPALAFTSDPTTGVYRISAGVVGVAASGALAAQIDEDGVKNAAGDPYLVASDLPAPSTNAETLSKATTPAEIFSTVLGTATTQRVRVRETNRAGAQASDPDAAPSLAWFWEGVASASIALRADGDFEFVNSLGDALVNVRALAYYGSGANLTDLPIPPVDEIPLIVSATPTAGSVISVTASTTFNIGAAAGIVFGVYNNSAGTILLLQGAGLTLRLAGSTLTGNRALLPHGLAVVYVISGTEYAVIGQGVQ